MKARTTLRLWFCNGCSLQQKRNYKNVVAPGCRAVVAKGRSAPPLAVARESLGCSHPRYDRVTDRRRPRMDLGRQARDSSNTSTAFTEMESNARSVGPSGGVDVHHRTSVASDVDSKDRGHDSKAAVTEEIEAVGEEGDFASKTSSAPIIGTEGSGNGNNSGSGSGESGGTMIGNGMKILNSPSGERSTPIYQQGRAASKDMAVAAAVQVQSQMQPPSEPQVQIQTQSQQPAQRVAKGGFGASQTQSQGQEAMNDDIKNMVSKYTAVALASAVRDREDLLQLCAQYSASGKIDELRRLLHPYKKQMVPAQRQAKAQLDLRHGLQRKTLNSIRAHLSHLPHHVEKDMAKRAAVILPLCNVDGVASMLFERRAAHMRTYSNHICFPGGKVDDNDTSDFETSLREMSEELGIEHSRVELLGVLRCDSAELTALCAFAVRPVVGFLGDVTEGGLYPNPDEVAECFTIPLSLLADPDRWEVRQQCAPVFKGGPHVIWGLTGHILHQFVSKVLWANYDSILELEETVEDEFDVEDDHAKHRITRNLYHSNGLVHHLGEYYHEADNNKDSHWKED